ncbi:IS982 family transposase [Acinetobacter nectaris]|uniref:IS982 family transposase n=1 Tax=Acinetobacter nectaris TaxID=1219382 RepID=UPI001EFFD6FC|nr:IS982 family transposase [Acinetobacter nectaris]MCF9045900.1 IS982 family transposase [Acinetobacter nectaris]
MLELSEVIFLAVWSYLSDFKKFKQFIVFTQLYHRKAFKYLPCYTRINALVNQYADAIIAFFEAIWGKAKNNHIHFMGSMPLRVCKNMRISRHRTFKEKAIRGKPSTGWFYGFKLHLMVNRACEIVSALVTTGKRADIQVAYLLLNMGKLFADRGYISKFYQQFLQKHGCELITRTRSNMAVSPLNKDDEHYMCQRNLLETVNGQLKESFGLENSRHRSWRGYIAHIYATLIVYQCTAISLTFRICK